MSRFKHNASIVVSGLFGVFLVWLALHETAPTAPTEPEQQAQETTEAEPEAERQMPSESEAVELAMSVRLPPPPSTEKAKPAAEPPAPKPVAEPPAKTEPVSEPPAKPEPVAETPPPPEPTPVPETVSVPVIAEPLVETPKIHPLQPSPPTEPAPTEPLRVEPLRPTSFPERPVSEPEPEIIAFKPMKPTPPKPVSAPEPLDPEPQFIPLRKPKPLPDVVKERFFEPLHPTPKPLPRPESARPAPVVRAPVSPPSPPRAAPPVDRTPPAEPTSHETVEVSFHVETPVVREGRALLRILEHGSGPGIEINWPDNRGQRAQLYQTLSACYGMKTVLMDASGGLFVADGKRGQAWRPNMDRYSGFVRQPQGYLAAEEQRDAAVIARTHGLGNRARVVRLFPRSVDAALLGGLRTLIGNGYSNARQIEADYRDTPSGLFVENIRVDGSRLSGRIAFPRIRSARCI